MGRRRPSWQLARSSPSVIRYRIIVVLFSTKHAVPRQIKPGILKLTITGGQSNFGNLFIFVSCEEIKEAIIVSFR